MLEYTAQMEQWLRSCRNPELARPMEAYLRNQFPFLGLPNPQRVQLTKQFWQMHGMPAEGEWRTAVNELWELPEREFQYTALALLEKHLKRAEPEDIDMMEKLVTSKSWWDTVDTLASNIVGPHCAKFPGLIPVYTERWIVSDHMWLRRTALLFQLKYKQRTDTDRLFRYIRACAGEREFFIRKAIGWALREYAKTDRDAVAQFVSTHELSPLSKREALKHFKENI